MVGQVDAFPEGPNPGGVAQLDLGPEASLLEAQEEGGLGGVEARPHDGEAAAPAADLLPGLGEGEVFEAQGEPPRLRGGEDEGACQARPPVDVEAGLLQGHLEAKEAQGGVPHELSRVHPEEGLLHGEPQVLAAGAGGGEEALKAGLLPGEGGPVGRGLQEDPLPLGGAFQEKALRLRPEAPLGEAHPEEGLALHPLRLKPPPLHLPGKPGGEEAPLLLQVADPGGLEGEARTLQAGPALHEEHPLLVAQVLPAEEPFFRLQDVGSVRAFGPGRGREQRQKQEPAPHGRTIPFSAPKGPRRRRGPTGKRKPRPSPGPFGGEGGIRTREGGLSPPTRFPVVSLQPLGHLSKCQKGVYQRRPPPSR